MPIPSAESHDHDVIIKSSDIERITVCHSKTIPTIEIALATGDVSGIVCICGMYTHMIQGCTKLSATLGTLFSLSLGMHFGVIG